MASARMALAIRVGIWVRTGVEAGTTFEISDMTALFGREAAGAEPAILDGRLQMAAKSRRAAS
jgi:hypothetical protein